MTPQLGLTWLEETDETSVLWAELEMSESSVMGFPQTVSMMQARNYGDGNAAGSAPGGPACPLSPFPVPHPWDCLPIPDATLTPSPVPGSGHSQVSPSVPRHPSPWVSLGLPHSQVSLLLGCPQSVGTRCPSSLGTPK